MKVVVTGGAGFIGSAIARALLARGDEVVAFDNLLTGFKENVPDDAELIEGDLRALDDVRSAFAGADAVVHQAALRSVPKSVDDPLLSASCNITGTLNALIAAEENGVKRLVYASSSSVYGGVDEGLNREDMTPNPLSPYAASKLAGEQYCKVWSHLKDIETVSLRYFNVYGPGQHPESKYSAVFPAFISALLAKRSPEVHWTGEQSRSFTFIDDVVAANLSALDASASVSGQVFNIGGDRSTSVNEVLRSIADAMDVWIEPTYEPMRRGDVFRSSADISKAEVLLGWSPKAAWQPSVEATVAWLTSSSTRPESG